MKAVPGNDFLAAAQQGAPAELRAFAARRLSLGVEAVEKPLSEKSGSS